VPHDRTTPSPRSLPHLLRALLPLVVAAGLLVGAAPASQAETWHHHDETSDQPRFGDIATVAVDARERRVHLRAEINGTFPEELVFHLDVDGAQRRPEFAISYGPYPGRVVVSRVDSWRGVALRERCRPRTARVRGDVLTAHVALRCLSLAGVRPERLRVSVTSRYELGSDYDHAPRRHHFGRWFDVG
jgi:hypothetical protein